MGYKPNNPPKTHAHKAIWRDYIVPVLIVLVMTIVLCIALYPLLFSLYTWAISG